MKIEEISKKDFESVLDLLDASFEEVSREYIEDALLETFDAPEKYGYVYGVWDSGRLIVTTIFGRCFDPDEGWNGEAHFRFLAVDENYRRQGYGKWMVRECLETLKDTDSPSVCISVDPEIPWLAEFWKNLGFRIYEEGVVVDGFKFDYWAFYL